MITIFEILKQLVLLLTFYHYKDVTIEVQDGETGIMLSESHVQISYSYSGWCDLFAPSYSEGLTDSKGRITLRAAEVRKVRTRIWTLARGYISDERSYGPHELLHGRNAPTLIIRLFRDPPPSMELVLPIGFRGSVSVQLQKDSNLLQVRPGQRRFTYRVPASGIAVIPAHSVIKSAFLGSHLRWLARFEEGTPIRSRHDENGDIADDVVALREADFHFDPKEEVFFVGTKPDLLRLSTVPVTSTRPPGSNE